MSPWPAPAQVPVAPYTAKDKAWFLKKNIPLNKYQWGTNKSIELDIYKILRHRKNAKGFLYGAIGMGVVAAIYKSNRLEGYTLELLVIPIALTSVIHFVLARTKAKKLHHKFQF